MAKKYRRYEPKQTFLIPHDIRDWLPEGHLAFFIDETVDDLDLSEIYDYYERSDRGQPPYHPEMMTKVIFYAYCTGMPSSRKIAKAMEEEVAFRLLGAGNFPDFRTISDFRKIHLKRLSRLFLQVLNLCNKAGLVKLGIIALDGSTVKANASKDKNRNYEALCKEEKKLQKEIEKALKKANDIDEEEDKIYGKDKRGDELPPGFRTRKERKERIRKAKEELEKEQKEKYQEYKAKKARRERKEKETGKRTRGWPLPPVQKEPDEKKKRNTTDPDSRLRGSRKTSWVQGYNVQNVVDAESQVILAHDVVKDMNDLKQLAPMLWQAAINTGRVPKAATADAGYWTEKGIKKASKLTELYISTTKAWKERKELLKTQPPRGRPPKDMTLKEKMERKLRSRKGREIYKHRGRSIEPVYGQIKAARGLKQFLLRGIEKVRGEWSLIAITHNILKLWRNRRPKPAL
jgi:transposase